jgi:Tol biopolymer transport system component
MALRMQRHPRSPEVRTPDRAARWTSVACVAALTAGLARAQTTECASVATGGAQGNDSSLAPAISADGRFVAFVSLATNLVVGDTNGCADVFVRDRLNGTLERVSLGPGGAQGNSSSGYSLGLAIGPALSADGRFVAFTSSATNLVAGDTNGVDDVFVRDRLLGTTERVSLDSGSVQGNAASRYPSISEDGLSVAFTSDASNLVPGDTNSSADIFVRNRLNGTTERASVSSSGVQASSASGVASISGNGRYVAFNSSAGNLVSNDTNVAQDIFVHDRSTGTTELASVSSTGLGGCCDSYACSISSDGRYVAFGSWSSDLVAGDSNAAYDIFVHDRQSGTTQRVSVDSGGAQANDGSYSCSISADGRFVAFESFASNLVPGNSNTFYDAFVRDRQLGTTERASVDSGGAQGNGWSRYPALSADGRFVAFPSRASNLVAGDTNAVWDVFVRDRVFGGSPATDLCQAGVGGVIACPCSNPPSSAPRGCDNSSATGGAQLASYGLASLAADSLVFVTHGEKPSATSVVLQGNAAIPNGLVFGQGVRCLGGALRRLYVQNASGGSILAPGAGDPSVSARSAALGDPIGAGTSRWYAVYYRDPILLGGCPATSTFNITQTQDVAWGS